MSDFPKCCICLEVYSRPTPLPCGHVFCLSCIGEYWRLQGQCLCPLCKTCFTTRPQLKVLETGCSQGDGDEGDGCQPQSPAPLRAGEVPCDVCAVPRPALRSCVECLASYCDFHLQPHYQDAELGRHLLVNVVKNLEGPVCKVHGKQLELFCRTDQTCICSTCEKSDHRGHHVITVKREAMRKKVQLKRRRSKRAQTIQERLSELEKLKLTTELENSKELLMELEEDSAELQRKQDEADQLLQMDDSLHFLQRFLLTAPL